MKRFVILITTIIITLQLTAWNVIFKENTCFAVPAQSSKQLKVMGEGIVLMDVKSGKVLYEQNAGKRMYPASTTKILTALLAIENGSIGDSVTVGREVTMIPEDASRADLRVGEKYTLKELLMALLLPSGNDAALAVATYIGRKTANDSSKKIEDALNNFIKLMNKRAMEIGARDSQFINPHGYHDDEHYSTAYDMALIAREAMKSDIFREIVKTPSFQLKGSYGTYRWVNTNLLINSNNLKYYYPFATGLKTGYTSEAGGCLVSSAYKAGVELLSIVLNSTEDSRFVDSRTIFEYGFNNYQYFKLINKDEIVKTINIDNGGSEQLNLVSEAELECLLSKAQSERVDKDVKPDYSLFEPSGGNKEGYILKQSISKNQVIGTIAFKLDGYLIDEVKLVSKQDIEKRSISAVTERHTNLLDEYSYIVFIFIVFIVFFCITTIYRKNIRKDSSRK